MSATLTMSDFNEHSFLAHHGILGMKWGIRRYQNKDGSLTTAGKIRYGRNIVLPKGQTMYRSASSEKSNFMNRSFTYVSATNDFYDHAVNVSEGFEGSHTVYFEMETKKPLKIATFEDYSNAFAKLFIKPHGNKPLKDKALTTIDKTKAIDIIRALPNWYKDGTFGYSKEFQDIVNELKNSGFSGVVDPVDGIHQYLNKSGDNRKVTAMVIFDPKENLIVKKIGSL